MRQSGFSLIELMITVAIIGVLTAIAVPNFTRYQMRARANEAPTNLQAISQAQAVYFAEYGSYLSVATPVPPALPGGARTALAVGLELRRARLVTGGRRLLPVRRQCRQPRNRQRPHALHGRGRRGHRRRRFFGFSAFVRPKSGQSAGLGGTLPGTTCAGSGVFNPASGAKDVLRAAGPCDGASGKSEF